MNHHEAAAINVPRVLNALEFMIKMHKKSIFLDELGFEFARFENYNGQMLTVEVEPFVTTEYKYKAQPSIRTKFSGRIDSLMFAGTRCMGNTRGFKSNLIHFNYCTKEWAIKIEDSNSPIIAITHKIEPGNVPTNHINDINDDAEIFQYSLMYPEIPDIVFDTSKRMMELTRISEYVDSVDMRMDAVILDLSYKDLEAEFNRKQQGFQNF